MRRNVPRSYCTLAYILRKAGRLCTSVSLGAPVNQRQVMYFSSQSDIEVYI